MISDRAVGTLNVVSFTNSTADSRMGVAGRCRPDEILPCQVDAAGVVGQCTFNGGGERRLIERRARAALLDGWRVILDDPLEHGMALHKVPRLEQFRVVVDVLHAVLAATELDGHL